LARPGVIFVAATLIPALACTLLIWRFLPQWWQLSAFFWYSIPGNSFVWLPHEPAVIYAGSVYPPALVAVVGGLATTVASAVDYVVVRRVLQIKAVASIKETRVFRLSVRWFNRWPWWTIFVFAISPIPFYPIRIIAPMANYPMRRYVSAIVVGRIPRYYVLALGGFWARQLTQL
jgi:ribonucleoside-triphosphate reductase